MATDFSTEPVGRERRGTEPLAELLRALEDSARAFVTGVRGGSVLRDDPDELWRDVRALEEAVEALDEYDTRKARARLRSSLWGRLRAALYEKENATIHRVERSDCAMGRMCNRGATWASEHAPEPRCKPHLDRRIGSFVETSMREASGEQFGGVPTRLDTVLAAYEKLGIEAPQLPDWAES